MRGRQVLNHLSERTTLCYCTLTTLSARKTECCDVRYISTAVLLSSSSQRPCSKTEGCAAVLYCERLLRLNGCAAILYYLDGCAAILHISKTLFEDRRLCRCCCFCTSIAIYWWVHNFLILLFSCDKGPWIGLVKKELLGVYFEIYSFI